MLGKLGGGGLGSLISRWANAVELKVSAVSSILKKEGVRGGIREVLLGRNEVISGISRIGPIDALPNTKRPGPSLYTDTDLQLSKAFKADFEVVYIKPGETTARVYERSMLYNTDRTKGAIQRQFEKRLQDDLKNATIETDLYGAQIIGVDFVGLEKRSDVDYLWQPDDAPWE